MPIRDGQFADKFKPTFGIRWMPVLPQETLKTWEQDKLLAYYNLRESLTQKAELNPVGDGFNLESWEMVMSNWSKYKNHVVLGGNRSAKSMLCARLAVWAACTIPGAEVHCYQVNKEKSIDEQQKYIWEAIPQSIKGLPTKKGQYFSLQYSQKNGFTDGVAIFPPHSGSHRGGFIRMHNYAQYSDDTNTAESFRAHVMWFDEECPLPLFKTAQYRTLDYRGRILLSFTTIQGWSPLIQAIIGKTKTLVKRRAPLAGVDLPVMQESLSFPDTCIYYFWTEDNAFIDVGDFRKGMKGKPRDEILARAYGIPTKSVTSVFPGFNKEINVIPHENIPFLKDLEYKTTKYMAVDPAGSKNWFMLWVAIDAAGTWWIYREWPDYDDWALPGSTIEGKSGPAQKGSKRGIKDYVELIRDAEKDEEIYERFIDPRLGAAERQSAEGATTIISDLDDAGLTFIPAPGVEIENGLQLINNLLAWDDTKKRDATNSPRLMISDRCQNLIYSMQEYTARGGPTEATKDPVDCLRYLCVSNCEFLETARAIPPTRSFSY